ncbi:MAG: carbohydrate-binding family 9-like protein [Verrucomicrobiae bacterium]|nr:carbohydrate-binding family 9-like protein [Verrucomicrobiae bacterium]
MNRIKMIFAVIAMVGVVLNADAAGRRTYPCHRLAQAPLIDGKMDDEAWKNIPAASGFYIFGKKKFAVEKQTSFKAGWTDDAVYIGIRAEENSPEKLKALGRDGSPLYQDDSIEVFLFPLGAPNYMQLIANSAGKRMNGRGPETINLLDWKAKAFVDKTEWLLELSIPFGVLMGNPPKEGDEWPVNVARNMSTGPAEERNSSWPFIAEAFYDVDSFGCFVLKGEAGNNVVAEEKKLNASYIKNMRDNIIKLAGVAGKYEKGLAKKRRGESLRVEAEYLRRTWGQVVKLAAQSDPDFHELRSATRAYVNLRSRSDDCVVGEMMEILLKD